MTTISRGICPKLHAQDHHSYVPIKFVTFLSMIVHQKLVKLSPLLKSRLKSHLPLKIDELMNPPGSYLHMDIVFYELESIQGFTSVLDVTCVSTRHPRFF